MEENLHIPLIKQLKQYGVREFIFGGEDVTVNQVIPRKTTNAIFIPIPWEVLAL